MTTDNIRDIFEDYITMPSVQNALLINGAWGSGKTFFWKNKLAPIASARGQKVIYVSLNGIRKIEALEHLMFIRMLPYLQEDEKGRKSNMAVIVGNIANAVSKHYLKNSLTDIFKGASVDMFDYKNTLVCFDDLERCQIPIKEVLGYINDFVEHKNLRTIILADETHILKILNEQVSYANIKEKVIGRVLNFSLEPNNILPQLFSRFSGSIDFFTFLQNRQNFITAIIEKSGEKNLRLVSFYLDILEKLYPLFKDEDQFIMDEILYFAVSICIEFKHGRLESRDYNDFKELNDLTPYYYSRVLAKPEGKEEDNDTKAESSFLQHYYDTYVGDNLDGYHFYPAIYSYVLSGYLDKPAFANDLTSRRPDEVADHIECFSLLVRYQFRYLENDEFAKLAVKVQEYAIQGLYPIYDYVQIADFYFFFSDNGLIELTNDQVRTFVLAGLDIVMQRKEINKSIFDNIMHFKKDNPETEKIKAVVVDMHKKIQNEQEQKVAEGLLELLDSADKEKIEKIFEDNRFSKSFLGLINMKDLANSIFNGPNRLISILDNILTNRYNPSNIGDFLAEDIEPLQQLELELNLLLKQDDIKQPKKFLLESILSLVKESWVKLQSTRKARP